MDSESVQQEETMWRGSGGDDVDLVDVSELLNTAFHSTTKEVMFRATIRQTRPVHPSGARSGSKPPPEFLSPCLLGRFMPSERGQ
jgi:hypothetical protein